MKRKMIYAAISYMLGLFFASFFTGWKFVFFVIGLSTVIIGTLVLFRQKYGKAVFLAVFFVFAMGMYNLKNADYEKIVVTIEDPVEIYNPNYCQVQIHETEDNATNFSSQKALQVILRQDPEIILYNEIRNKTDAETVIQAGATGHQVFTTLHANDCITAISRLLDLGVSKVSLLNQVNLISSQRLIGILCPHCQREYKLSESDKILLSKEEYNRLSTIDLKQIGTVEQRNNCPHCNHTGYINRIAIVEYVLFNDDLKDILYHTSSMKEIKEALKKNKFISMWEKGLDYVVAGKTSLIELYNQIGNKDAINNLINNL